MVPAHYMIFRPGHHGSLDRLGGLPTHLPPRFLTAADSMAPEFERPAEPGPPMRFLAQFYCDPVHLPLPDTLCIQLYQSGPEYEPWPAYIRVPHGAKLNTEGLGVPAPEVIPHDVAWEQRDDPDQATVDDDDLAKSKVGGTCYFSDCLDPGEKLLLQLRQQPGGFHFGGYTLVLAINEQGVIRPTLG